MASTILDILASRPSLQDRYMSVLPYLNGQGTSGAAGTGLSSLISGQGMGSVPGGPGIFSNNQVDVLQPGDPRLRSVGGTTLARPAARSLIDVLRGLNIPVQDVGGGYRSPSEQAATYASKPGLAAPPGSSYHQEGLAIDLASRLQTPAVARALAQAGWNRFSPQTEPWHWSFGVTG